MISNKDIGEALAHNDDVVSCQFLGKGVFLLQMFDMELPQKMNSYAVMKIVDPKWFELQFTPQTYPTNLMEEDFCLQPPVRVAEEWEEESSEIELDSIGELETFEDFANDWEEIESDDGHRELYQNE